MRSALPGLFDELRVVPGDANGLLPAEYAKWDTVLYKLDVIRRYVAWREAGKREDRSDANLEQIEQELVRRMLLFSWEGFDAARRYIREMQQNIFAEDIETQITAGNVKIRKDRFLVRPFAPTQFHLEFTDPAYDTAEAQREWTCVWCFNHGRGPQDLSCVDGQLREYGWIVSHYFPNEGCYPVETKFRPHQAGGIEISLAPREIPVQAENKSEVKSRRWHLRVIEGSQLLLAILPALLALMAGARDQLLKLDLVPAWLAIFAIGFGSDQIKNKLTQ